MKKLFIIILLLYACSGKKESTNNIDSTATIKDSVVQQNAQSSKRDTTPYIYSSVDINYVIKNCRKRELNIENDHFSWDSTSENISIPEEFLEKHIYNLPLSFGDSKYIAKDNYSSFRFGDYYEYALFTLFTITYADETCCLTTYGITVDKTTNKITDAALLYYRGGDGDWGHKSIGEWTNDSVLTLSVLDSEGATVDSLSEKITVLPSGKLKLVKVDSAHFERH